MTDLNEFDLWVFTKEPLEESSVVECPECKKASPIKTWWIGGVGCSDCGEHAAMVCPECCEHFDHVHCPHEFKVV